MPKLSDEKLRELQADIQAQANLLGAEVSVTLYDDFGEEMATVTARPSDEEQTEESE